MTDHTITVLDHGHVRLVDHMGSVLPVNTYTHFFGTIDLHNLLHFLGLRLHPHAQWEIQQYAQAMLDLARPIAPYTIAAFEEMNQ